MVLPIPNSLFARALKPIAERELFGCSILLDGEPAKYSCLLTPGIASFVVNLAERGSAEVSLVGKMGAVDCLALPGPSDELVRKV